ncbi:MAG TPA: hypothetical protein VKQ73_02060 [Stellaceae bacterium]|nr:hypothetical protein [Stellaceae bacterium]
MAASFDAAILDRGRDRVHLATGARPARERRRLVIAAAPAIVSPAALVLGVREGLHHLVQFVK